MQFLIQAQFQENARFLYPVYYFRHPLEPRNEEEAKQFQAENLLLASRSGQVSRAISRVGSRIMSRRSSVQSSAMASRQD